jgi:hypothetical protein
MNTNILIMSASSLLPIKPADLGMTIEVAVLANGDDGIAGIEVDDIVSSVANKIPWKINQII